MKTQDLVVFTDQHGNAVVATVGKIWGRVELDPRPPLINLRENQSGEMHTSVPHKTDVVGATGFFYS